MTFLRALLEPSVWGVVDGWVDLWVHVWVVYLSVGGCMCAYMGSCECIGYVSVAGRVGGCMGARPCKQP